MPIVAQGHKCVTVNPTGCGLDPHSRKLNIYLNLYFHFITLVRRQSAVLCPPLKTHCFQNSVESGLVECLNTRFSLPNLLCAGNSVKLIF